MKKPLAWLYSLRAPFSSYVLGVLLRRRGGKGKERKVMGRAAGGQGREDKVSGGEGGRVWRRPAWPFDCSKAQIPRL